MLYLHCGWPRTSTSSLQSALFEHRDRLAAAGVVYPEKWWAPTGLGMTHRGLVGLLRASSESDDAFDDFKRYLAAHADVDVLLSAEILTEWLLSEERQDALLGLILAAREVGPARCVWTLRRLDDAISSLFLRAQAVGSAPPPLAEQLGDVRRLNPLFAGMRRVEDAVGGDAVYLEYDPAGAHNGELLRAFGIPEPVRVAIAEDLERGPRVNASLSHKQIVTMVHLDALSARAGVELDGEALRKAFYSGDLKFEEDRPCELVGEEGRRSLHERALGAAREQGFAPYVEFFGDAEVNAPSPVSLEPDVVTDEDLRQLTAFSPLPR